MNENEIDAQAMIEQILASRKYRDSGLNPNTIADLIRQEAPHQTSRKALLKSVRRKLHNIVAPYLGEPDYVELTERLDTIRDTSLESPELRSFCLDILTEHASTAERIPYMDEFYGWLFSTVGKPATLMGLACGLHPLAFPWMGLPLTTRYHAYDIIQPRIDFINTFFEKIGLAPLAENRDILVDPPTMPADLALFFKEAHRFEKRQPGSNQAFWASLDVHTLAISLPTQNLSGTHNLLDQHRDLVYANLPENKTISELSFENEIIFLVDHPGKGAHG